MVFSFGLYIIQLRKKDLLTLARVRVSCQCFPVSDCASYSYAGRTSWLSLGLGLVVSVFSFGLYIIQLRKKDLLTLARVRVSCQCFSGLDCISYFFTKRNSWLSLWLVLVASIFQFWIVSYSYARRIPGFGRVWVNSQYLPVLDCISYNYDVRTS